VRERSGIDFAHYKMPTIRRRLQRRMAAMAFRLGSVKLSRD
jgi:hypothetical protein